MAGILATRWLCVDGVMLVELGWLSKCRWLTMMLPGLAVVGFARAEPLNSWFSPLTRMLLVGVVLPTTQYIVTGFV